ncbi:alcohol dehydrogenase catalytic domain-containing protein [Candidatus Entotheonella palauensis]|uniref:alcohol dehydrogenase catalytic domain-containing protein n=1 Tax=Candidatus Entotheonella palauensis TaxID=93172 RepID=UPI000B7E2BFD|nr:hypothetical protein [Candidatus Entotheonella palauensis]
MSTMQAVVADPNSAERLVIRDVPAPSPAPFEALVRVAAISLNRGETRGAFQSEVPWQPGWDAAGVVEQPAADGSGPPAGARVVGIIPNGAWAQQVAIPTFHRI